MKSTSTVIKSVLTAFIVFCISTSAFAQKKETISVISIDTKGITATNELVASIVSLELEKIDTFEVLDKYEVQNILSENKIDPHNCFGKSQLLRAGKLLKVDRLISGSVEKFGDKIIVILRMINMEQGVIEKVDVMEYIDMETKIQSMMQISLNNLLNIPNDPVVVDILSNVNLPITVANSKVNLSGPRFGFYHTTGTLGDRLRDSKSNGGFEMHPLNTMFGYQYEVQFISAGDFQALFEFIGAVNGVESGYFIPSLSMMMGARFNNIGLEFGFGPVFRMGKMAEGYYDANSQWQLLRDYQGDPSNLVTEMRVDSRGEYRINPGLIIAMGYTFRSGYLNLPVNFYWIPSRDMDSNVFGVNFGFNMAKRPKLKS